MKSERSEKILYAASSADHLRRFHSEYIAALEHDGYTVKTLARGDADFDVPFEKRIFSPKNLLLIPKIRRIIANGGFCAIILNTSLAAFYVRLACPRKGRPKIINIVHGYLFSEGERSLGSQLMLTAEKLLRRKTDVIITMNGEDTRLAREHRLTDGKILKIPGMGARIRAEITPPEAIRQDFFPKEAYVLTFVGELSKRKNQRLIIEALKTIKKQIPEAFLCLVGDGKERKHLEILAKRLGLANSVVFVGERRDACDFIRASDLCVSASLSEGLPFNVVEALGAEKTVIASDIKGHKDLIKNGVTGFLFDSNDSESLAETVVKIHTKSPELSRKAIRKKYSQYEFCSVFPTVYSVIRSAIKPSKKA